MAFKILTKNGVQNTNVDGARDHNFNAGGRSGIVLGALNECNIFASSSNTYAIDTGELRICGHRVVITELEYRTMLNIPSTNIRYSIVAQIKVESGSQEEYAVSFQFLLNNASTPLIQDDLDKNIIGTYQLELARFTYTTSGEIEDIVRTADLITGGSGDGQIADIEFNASAYELESNMEPEVSVDFNEETKKYDMQIGIPKGQDGLDGSGSNPNLLINGDFRVNQRGETSYSNFANKYCVDRWFTGGANVTVTPIDTGTKVSVLEGGQYYWLLGQKLENIEYLVGKTITLSAHVRSTNKTITNYYIPIRISYYSNENYTNIISFSATYISSAGFYSCSGTVPENTKSIIVGLYKNAECSVEVDLDYIKLEVGSVATPFSPRPYAEELAMCQRYYQVFGGVENFGNIGISQAVSISQLYVYLNLISEMRISPTITLSGELRFRQQTNTVTNIQNFTYSTQNYSQNCVLLILQTTDTMTTGAMGSFGPYNDSTAKVALDAEIY